MPEARATSQLRRWLVPDIAFILSAITMVYCLTPFNGMTMLFRDSDTGWHIRNGEAVLARGGVPHTEPYSFSKPAGDWFAWEWLADITMAKAHGWDGMRGVFFLYLGVLGLVSWLWFQLMWTAGAWFLVTCVASWVMLTTCNIHWLARPHLFGWVFLAVSVLMAEHAPGRLRWSWVAGAFAMGALWANMHGSFFLGAAILFLYAGEGFLRANPQWKMLAAMGLALSVASFANPYGWQVHAHIVHYLQDKELLSHVGEFQTFNFHVEGAEAITIGMVLLAAGISLNIVQGRWARGILCLVMFAGALRSARGLPLMAIVGLPLALGAICKALSDAKLPARFAKMRDDFAQYNLNLRKMESGFGGWALAPLAMLVLVLIGRTDMFAKQGFPEDQFPVKVSGQIAKLPAEARLYAPDKFGGYLIYRFAGTRKVFFDGRSDYYGADFLKDYLLIAEGKPGWEAKWAQWGFTHALLPKDSPLLEILPLKGWTRMGNDDVATLLTRGTR